MTVMAVDATLHLCSCLSNQMVFLYSLPHTLQHKSWVVVQRPSINNKKCQPTPNAYDTGGVCAILKVVGRGVEARG